ncbi:IS481 family transposase [Thermodesulfobacteriota bacterium B35]
MEIRLHKNARTTPAVRRETQQSSLSERALAAKYGITRATVRKWKKRDTVEDRSHRPWNLRATLSPLEEEIVVELRTSLLLPLDDLLAVVREFINPNMSRSALDRCLRRHGVSRLSDLVPKEESERKKVKAFKTYKPGFLHADIKYLPRMPDEQRRKYLFVAIDRATRWVYLEIRASKSAASAAGFLANLIRKAPFRINIILTDNGKEFTDRFCATGERKPTGNHPFDLKCQQFRIDHRLIRPRHPQSNGMVERFNDRIKEVVTQTRFHSADHLKETLTDYSRIYNHHIPQKNLGHITPIQALKKWQRQEPDLFTKSVYNLSGPIS